MGTQAPRYHTPVPTRWFTQLLLTPPPVALITWLSLLSCLGAIACASAGHFVWYSELPAAE